MILELLLVTFIVYLGWEQQNAHDVEIRNNHNKYKESRGKHDIL